MMAQTIDAARDVIRRAVTARVFPAAAVEVGASDRVLWQEAFGALTFDPSSAPATAQTIFDLASLTKAVATTTIVMQLVQDGRLAVDEPVSAFFSDWRGNDREHVTIRDLLEHASGLAARLVDTPPVARREFEHDIATMKLEYEPRTRSVYSDLGFILLGFAAVDRGGQSLAQQFDRIVDGMKPATTTYRLAFEVPSELRHGVAPTVPLDEDLRRGEVLTGAAHDNYAAALGGIAGHAGLFGTASAVGTFAREVLKAARGDESAMPPLAPALMRQFLTRSGVPGSSRALGWDTMLPTSSCGTRMSASAFGHVGFTGTSLWIDPEHDRYFVLLTNRAYGDGTLDHMRTVRRAFHDALAGL